MNRHRISVSLKYPRNVDAPLITARAHGVLAEKMVQIARENDIPVVEDDLAANIVSLGQIGDCIPEAAWRSVAGIFAMISSLEHEDEPELDL